MIDQHATILHAPRGTTQEVATFLEPIRHRVARSTDLLRYLTEVFRLAPLVGIDPAIVVAQSAVETGNWTSRWWVERLNPAGIGITGDPRQNAASHTWTSGTEAARAQLAHLLLYAEGTREAEEDWWEATGTTLASVDPRYDAYVNAYGERAAGRTLAELTGKWAVDPEYGRKVAAKFDAIFRGEEPMPETARPYVLVVAGHRAYQDAGNPAEKALTPALAADYTAALRAAGYRADWWQRDIDADADPDDTVGGLDTVARGVGAHLARTPGGMLMLDCHYNGASSPLHVIVPDAVGLSTAYAGGAPADDTAAVNVLDVRVATAIAAELARATGLPLYRGMLGTAGLMSERETGVGRDGDRLAMFAGTALVRDRAVRLVIEHGGTDDPPVRQNDFTERCAAALVRALDAVYGAAEPEPAPAPPPWRFDPKLIWPDQTKGALGTLWELECRKRKSWGKPDPAFFGRHDGAGGKLYRFDNGLLIRKTEDEKVSVVA